MNAPSLIPGAGRGLFAYARYDVPAGAVVFLVAVPLCLGIAQASGAPLLSGLIAGLVGGIVVPILSRSELSVSGPAAGLAVLVADAIRDLGFRSFLTSVCVAGLLQIVLGVARAGLIAHFLPASVIKGMLAAIGLLILLKQIPHAVGYDSDFEGDESFREADGHNTLTALVDAVEHISLGAVLVSAVCAAVVVLWPLAAKRATKLGLVPVQLLMVIGGGLLAFVLDGSPLAIAKEHFVSLPVFRSVSDIGASLVLPHFEAALEPAVWRHGLTLGVVASLETLLSIEAIDRLDPHKRISPPNRELIAQGIANGASGLLGGLPVTSVIVRSSANLQAGGKTRLAAIVHGVLLLVGLVAFATVLNRVPLAALAIVLIAVGLKLSSLELWRGMWRAGPTQFVPFAATVVSIIGTDLLKGTMIGAAFGLAFMIRAQQKNAMLFTERDGQYLLTLVKDVTFLQKAHVKEVLRQIPDGAYLAIDRRLISFIDDDVEEILDEFAGEAPKRGITFEQKYEAGGLARRKRRFERLGLPLVPSEAPRTSP